MQAYDFKENRIIGFNELMDTLGIRNLMAFLNTADATYAQYYRFDGRAATELEERSIYIVNSSTVYPIHGMCLSGQLLLYMEHTIIGKKSGSTDSWDAIYIVAEKDSKERRYSSTNEYSLTEITRMVVLSGGSIFNDTVIVKDTDSSYIIDILALTGYYRHEIKKELVNTEPTEQMKTAENMNRKIKMLGGKEQYIALADGRTCILAEKDARIIIPGGLKVAGIYADEKICIELLEFKEGSSISLASNMKNISSIYKVKIHSCDILDKVKKLSDEVNIYMISVPCSISINEFSHITRDECSFIEIRGSKGDGILSRLGERVQYGREEGTFIYKNRY